MRPPRRIALAFIFLTAVSAFATVFGSVRGVIHDPQHRPVQGAKVVLRSTTSEWQQETVTNDNGAFLFTAVPAGMYQSTTSEDGFAPQSKQIEVNSGTGSELHFQFAVASVQQKVDVSAAPELVNPSSSTTQTLISRSDIANTPGADRANSLSLITDYVPGAYMVHDQLHVRGGHQTSWLVDGVPVPNTNIASNVGPQYDPKDVDYLEVSRGGYGAESGDRTYGVFNVVPRTGFERNREAELVLSAGNFYQTNDQFSFGSHTARFAYYASVNGNRSNLGIETPVPEMVHDAANGYGGFGTLIFNADPSDQFRLVSSFRRDYYQIPYDPFTYDIVNGLVNGVLTGQYPSLNLRVGDHEADAVANVSWVHTFNSKTLMTVSPFYHYNRATYESSVSDPVATTDHRSSKYAAGHVSFSARGRRNDLQVGLYSFYQRNSELVGATFNDGSGNAFLVAENPTGSMTSFFIDDKFKPATWLTLSV